MSRYLARLVARAQPLAPPPAPTIARPATALSDPFENTAPTAPAVPVSPPVNSTPSSATPRAPAPTALQAPVANAFGFSKPVPLSSPAQTDAAQKTVLTPPAVASTPGKPSENDPSVPSSSLRPTDFADSTLLRPIVPSQENSGIRDTDTVGSENSNDQKKLAPAPANVSPGRPSDADDDEARLQRAADAFMARLIARPEPLAPPPTSPEESTPLRPAVDPRPAAPRLQPAAHIPAPAAPPPAPSVVIGQLTVEVTSPSPPPTAPRPRAPIHRVSGSRSSPGVPSSARFGLGQM